MKNHSASVCKLLFAAGLFFLSCLKSYSQTGTNLNFDGVNDGITLTTTNFPMGSSARTIEAWMRTSQVSGGGCIMTYGNISNSNRFSMYQTNGYLYFAGEYNDYNTGVYISDGNWHHVAASYDGSNLKLYVDGVQAGTTQAKALNTTGTQFNIGTKGNGVEYFTGDIDEVRVWNLVRTPAQLASACVLVGNETGLVAYYRFDQGTAAAANATITTLTDALGVNNGTLSNFTLTPGATSNWVGTSPIALPPSALAQSFCPGVTVASLTPAQSATVNWYNVATGGSDLPTTTALATGTYYLTSVSTNGCESNRVPVPVYVNTVSLSAVANKTVCNNTVITATTLSATAPGGTVCGTAAENGNLVLTAPTGSLFTSIPFASFGTPTGSCGNFAIGACNDVNSVSKVTAVAVGQNTVTIPATNAFFSDPCSGTSKWLSVQAAYSPTITYSWTNNNTAIGLAASGTGSTIPAFTAVNSTASAITATITITASANGCTSAAQTFTITVNPTPAAPTASAQSFCSGKTVANLVPAPSSTNNWYSVSTGGTALATTTALATGTYYVTAINASGCESGRTSVAITINALPAAPTTSAQAFCTGATVASLVPAPSSTNNWYNVSTGGTALATTTALTTGTYYVTAVNASGCESGRTSVAITVNALPAAPTASAQAFCSGKTVASLVPAPSSTNNWYNVSTGGTALVTTTALATGTYYVTAVNASGCESGRTSVAITVNALPAAPTASTQYFCGSATVASLVPAPSTTNNWYNVSTGGTALATTTALATGTYYVTAVNASGCESGRTNVGVNILTVPATPTVTSPLNECQNATPAALTATGTGGNLLWYTMPTGGTGSGAPPTPSTTTVSTTNYYVSQVINYGPITCESPRNTIAVIINSTPAAPTVTTSLYTYCQFATATALTATGSSLKWYNVSYGGSPIATGNPGPVPLTNNSSVYYVSQTAGVCESQRTGIVIQVNTPPAPPSAYPFSYCLNEKANAVSASGPSILWYTMPSGGTGSSIAPIPSTNTAGTVYYYATASTAGCESFTRTQVSVTVNSTPPSLAAYNYNLTSNVSGITSFSTNCSNLITTVSPNGTLPLSGNTRAKVWLESTQPAGFVSRHYEIAPSINPTTATANITLYFLQSEFDAFNAVNTRKLPTGPSDAAGIANLLIEQYSGTSSDNTGLPATYTGSPVSIDPADANIIWNTTASRWEVTFAATGFGGFFVNTTNVSVPTISSFTPASAPVGSLVTITGTNLNAPTAFTIGGVPAIVISNDSNTLVAMVMPGAATGTIILTNAAGTATSSSNFTVTLPLTPNSQQGSKFTAADATGPAKLGSAVALSADGNTAIVGGVADNAGIGAAWIYTRSGGTWSQQGNKLAGSDATANANQGSSVALSADGNTALVGAFNDNGGNGAVFVYTRNGSTWTQQGSKLTASDGNTPNLGFSVALSADGNTAVAGGNNDVGDAGAIWIFTRSGNTWTQQGNKLVGTGATGTTSGQGHSVSISADGNMVISGAPGDNSNTGATWVFVRTGTTWSQQGNKLVGTGAVAGNIYQGFSASLSADGNTLITGGCLDNGNTGASWIFTRSGSTWSQQGGKLVGTNSTGSLQGYSVSLSADGNTAMAGGTFDNGKAGAAWIFARSGSTWTQYRSKLVGSGGVGMGYQGNAVALSADGTTAIEGGNIDASNTGSAWVFVWSPPATALNFDGIDDGISVTATGLPLGNSARTIEAWVNTTQMTGGAAIMTYGDLSTNNRFSLYNSDGNLNFVAENNDYNTGQFIADGRWHHVAATFDETNLKIYLDGNLAGTMQTVFNTTGTQFSIGYRGVDAEYFSGTIDELRIWNRALCQAEIQNNMNAVLNPTGQTGLLALYHFDEGFTNGSNLPVTTLIDSSGNGNNGILQNFALTGTASNWVNGTVTGNSSIYIPAGLAGAAGDGTVSQIAAVNILGTYFQDAVHCGVIAAVLPSGASPVTGNVNTKVTIDAAVQAYLGQPYVQRHYDIEPANNAANATATVTLYYTQAEFDAYNAVRGLQPALPASGSDAAGIANLRITQYHGTGTAPGNYTGTVILINPSSVGTVLWNTALSRWEVTFPVNGFSGFYVHTSSTNSALPLTLLRFNASKINDAVLISWQTSNEQNANHFEVERSINGISFDKISTVPATNGASINNYQATDYSSWINDLRYYRLKSVDNDGKFTYSGIVTVNNRQNVSIAVYPNPVKDEFVISLPDKKLLNSRATLIASNGNTVKTLTINNMQQTVNVSDLSAGIYMLHLANGKVIKLLKE